MLKDLVPSLTELGKIKIGRKANREVTTKSGKTFSPPEKLDHFIITGCERDSAGQLKIDERLMSRLLEKYGVDDKGPDGKPRRVLRELPVSLLSDDVDEVLLARYCYYTGRKLGASCDGEKCTYFKTKEGGTWKDLEEPRVVPCNGEHETDPNWKLHATLNVVIADGEARWGGVYKFRTTSRISASQLLGTILQVKALTNGILQGLPLRLVVRPMEAHPTNAKTGEEMTTTVFVVHLELRGADLNAIQRQALELAQVRVRNAKELAAVQGQYRALLAAPGELEDEEEQAAIAEEFHPGEENAVEAPKRGRGKKASEATVDAKPAEEKPAAELETVAVVKSADGKVGIVDQVEKPKSDLDRVFEERTKEENAKVAEKLAAETKTPPAETKTPPAETKAPAAVPNLDEVPF